jgi:putative DNA primase/helicase
VRVEDVPPELRALDRWVCWRAELRGGRLTKVPISPTTGGRADITDPRTWSSLEDALRLAEAHSLPGVGFVFAEGGGLTGVDIDGCHDLRSGEVESWALGIVEALDSYTEISPSGTGLKIFLKGTKPGERCVGWVEGRRVEVYDHARFFAITGRRFRGDCVENRQAELRALYGRLFPAEESAVSELKVRGFPGDDAALLEAARNAANGEKFRALYDEGSLAYHGGDHSSADMALMTMLACFTGCDPERMERLFDGSALARRKKWRDRPDYRGRTVERAIRYCRAGYTGGFEVKPSVAAKLEVLESWAMQHSWSERGGARNRHVCGALVDLARARGRSHLEGVAVVASARELCLEAGIGGRSSLDTALAALRKSGRVALLRRGTDGGASTYLLRVPPDRGHEHLPPPVFTHGPSSTTGSQQRVSKFPTTP